MYHFFLSEFGDFRFPGNNNYIGGWACSDDDLIKTLLTTEKRLWDTSLLDAGNQRLAEIKDRDLNYLAEYTYMLIKVQSQPNTFLSPVEIWKKTVVQAVAEILKKIADEDCTIHIRKNLPSIKSWISGSPEIKDSYYEYLAGELFREVQEFTGYSESFEIAFNSEVNNQLAFVEVITERVCFALKDMSLFSRPVWKNIPMLYIEDQVLTPSEGAFLRRALSEDVEPAEILWQLLENDGLNDTLYKECLEKMTHSSWLYFCDIVTKRLLQPLTTGLDRYKNLFYYRRIAESLPEYDQLDNMTLPYKLIWLKKRCLQKCDAHQGIILTPWFDELQPFLSGKVEGVFSGNLDRLQAEIDVFVDDVQIRIVNPLNLDEMDKAAERTRTLLERYKSLFPSELPDENVARLAGTLGQLLALQVHKTNYKELLGQALNYFKEDSDRVGRGNLFLMVQGYLFLTTMELGEPEMASLVLKIEEAWLRGDSEKFRQKIENGEKDWMCNLADSGYLFQLSHLLHYRFIYESTDDAIHALGDYLLDGKRDFVREYPANIMAKWCALHLFKSLRKDEAATLLQKAHAGMDKDSVYEDAVSHIRASIYAMQLEIEESGQGQRWWYSWLDELPPGQDTVAKYLKSNLELLPDSPLDRLQSMSLLLPFYFH